MWEAPAACKLSSACVAVHASLARNLPSSCCFQWNFSKSTILISGKCAAKIGSFITRNKLVVLNLPNILTIILVPQTDEFGNKVFTKSNRNGISLFLYMKLIQLDIHAFIISLDKYFISTSVFSCSFARLCFKLTISQVFPCDDTIPIPGFCCLLWFPLNNWTYMLHP